MVDQKIIMDLNETQIINFEKICRLCLNEKHFLTDIFDSTINDSCLSIDKKIMACASIELYKDDGLPSQICGNCLSSVNAAFDFRIQCENADKTLHDVKTLIEAETDTCKKKGNVKKKTVNGISDVVFIKQTDGKNSTLEDSSDVLYVISDTKLGEKYVEGTTNFVEDYLLSSQVLASEVLVNKDKKCILTISNESDMGGSSNMPQLLDNEQTEVKMKEEVISEEVELKEEQKLTGEAQKMPCPYCNKRLARIDEHIRLLHRNRVYKCIKDGCGAEFLTLKNLQSHQLNCYKLKKGYKCTKCLKEFHRKSNYKAHIRRHGNKKDFKCQFCEKAFVDSTGLKRHFLKHHEPEQEVFISGCCGKRFKSKEGLKKHIQKSICGIKIFQVVSTDNWDSVQE